MALPKPRPRSLAGLLRGVSLAPESQLLNALGTTGTASEQAISHMGTSGANGGTTRRGRISCHRPDGLGRLSTASFLCGAVRTAQRGPLVARRARAARRNSRPVQRGAAQAVAQAAPRGLVCFSPMLPAARPRRPCGRCSARAPGCAPWSRAPCGGSPGGARRPAAPRLPRR